jgi:pullulanase
MQSFAEVQHNLTFLNTGQNQIPGVIAMRLSANGGSYGRYQQILIVFNGTNASTSIADPSLQGMPLHLHPVQRSSADPTTRQSTFQASSGTATVPPLTIAVFVTGQD